MVKTERIKIIVDEYNFRRALRVLIPGIDVDFGSEDDYNPDSLDEYEDNVNDDENSVDISIESPKENWNNLTII